MSSRKKIKKFTKIRSDLLTQISEGFDEILRGSYCVIYTKCGKANCRCKEGKGHPHARITWREKGMAITRKVPRKEIDWVLKVTENYRKFRDVRKKIINLEAELKMCIDLLENELVKKTRKGKSFLEIN